MGKQEILHNIICWGKLVFQTCFCAGLYDWPPFVIAPGFSVIGILLMAALENTTGLRFLGQTTLEEIAAAASAEDKISKEVSGIAHVKVADVENNMKLKPLES